MSPGLDRTIRIWPLIAEGVRRCWAARDDLLRLGAVPSVVLLVLAIPNQAALMARLRIDGDSINEADARALFLIGACYAAVTCVFAVNWIRQLTLGYHAVPGLGLAIGARHFRFFFLQLALSIAVVISMVIMALLLQPFGLPGVLGAVVLNLILLVAAIARLSPSWIGVAIDAPMPLAKAWRRTAGQGFKLVLALLAVEAAFMVLVQIIEVVFLATGLVVAAPLTFMAVVWVMNLIKVATQISVLVAAYPQFLREDV